MKLTFFLLSALSTLAVSSSPVEKRATVASTTTCMTQIREFEPSTPFGCIRSGRVERVRPFLSVLYPSLLTTAARLTAAITPTRYSR